VISQDTFIVSVIYLNAKDKVLEYKLDKLPSKLKQWVVYAQNIVKVLYQKTPMMNIITNGCNNEEKVHFDIFYNFELMLLLINTIN